MDQILNSIQFGKRTKDRKRRIYLPSFQFLNRKIENIFKKTETLYHYHF